MNDLRQTADTIEVLWTVITTLTLLVNVWTLWDAGWDWQAIHSMKKNGRLSIIARANFRRAVVHLLVQAAFAAIGIAAVLTPSSVRPGGEPGVLQLIVPPALIACAILLAINSVADRADRHIVLRIIRRGQATT